MISKSNQEKTRQLGIPHGTAASKLRKAILFQCVQQLGRDVCFQCQKTIETVGEFSIDHKVPWLHSNDPIGLFFDLDNIAFSHLSCNIASGRRDGYRKPCPTLASYRRGCRCKECVDLMQKDARELKRKRRGTDPRNYRV